MTQAILNIPDNEIGFFMKLIEKLNYKTEINNYELLQEMKALLDERKITSLVNKFVKWEDVKSQINFQK
jgi:hypothetical protein